MSGISKSSLLTIDKYGLVIENKSSLPDKAAGGISSIAKDVYALSNFFKQSDGQYEDEEYDENQDSEEHKYYNKVNIRFEGIKLFKICLWIRFLLSNSVSTTSNYNNGVYLLKPYFKLYVF